MSGKRLSIVTASLAVINICTCANILMITMGGTKSHKIPFWELARGLIPRGHNITFISAFPADFHFPGLEEITPADLVFYVRNFTNWDLVGARMKGDDPVHPLDMIRYGYEACDIFLSDQETKDFLYQSQKFDLLILDGAYPECALGFVHHFNAPFMYINTVGFYIGSLSMAGNPTPYSITPFLAYSATDNMNLIQRTKNTMWHMAGNIMHSFMVRWIMQDIVEKHFGKDTPPIYDISKNVSFILQNGHSTMTYPRPYLPNVAEIACIHCKRAKPLPEKFVLDDKDVVCGSCRMALIYCVRFIDRCLKAEANRKDSLVCLEDPLDELEDGSNIIQDDSLPDVAHNKPSTIIDLKLSNNFQDDGSSQVNEYFERCEEAIDQVIDITKNEHDYSISNDNLQDEHTKTNDSDDNLQDESAKALSNDSSNDDEIECGEALPNNILGHNRIISAIQPSDEEFRNFMNILSTSGVKTFQHFQDLEQTSKKKRVLLIASSFKCRRCSEYFSTNGNYNSHMRNHRRYEERRVAREKLRQLRLQKKEDIVRKRLASQMNPPLKKKYRKTQNDLQCKTCSHVCSSKDDLQLHIKTHPHIVCEQCGKGFATTGQLGAHKNVHNDPNSYICEICGKAYKTIGQLRVHGQNHENKVFLCSKCPKVFKMKIGLSRHVKYTHGEGLDKLWSCKVCGKLFKVSGALKSHYCQTHLRDGPLKCEVCGQGFFRTDYLKRHKRRHVIYGDGIPVPVPLKRARKSDDTETNGSETVLRRRRHHWPPGPYECQICKKLFKKIENLKLHIERHSLLSRYSCKYCNMSFKIKYQRNRHEKRHETSELNYRCGICWRRLSNQEELDLHLLNHNNLKYKCEFCEEAFARKHLLNDHIVWCHTQHGDAEEELKTLMTMGLGDLYKE